MVHTTAGYMVYTAYTFKNAFQYRENDVYWCTADVGWITGHSYIIYGPLANGATTLMFEGVPNYPTSSRFWEVCDKHDIAIFYTAPTALRALMREGDEPVKSTSRKSIRILGTVGEPINPEAWNWYNEIVGKGTCPIVDTWWQTETGGIMIANYASMDVKPGSMGKPLPGIEAGIVEVTDAGAQEITKPQANGELALRPGWPSMMRTYLGQQARYEKSFRDGWYLSGDLAMRDKDGYYWFVGRSDDVIKSAGHLIGPFEVESALMEHPAVAEVGVIGIPDETAGEIVKAYIALKPGFEPGDELQLELLGHARKRLGPAVAPKEIAFRQNLPKTRSGKIMRRLLKARELGLPEGDISTLESDEK